MYPSDPVPDGPSVAQLNAELRDAHLELLSAHCAAYQLRLRYSTDDLAGFGQHDVLRKSAEAAGALNEFYSAIAKKIPGAAPAPEIFFQPSSEEIAEATHWLSSCLRSKREHYFPSARLLSSQQMAMLSPYFSAVLLEGVRIAELHGARVPVPDFYALARAKGFANLPEISHMESLTFVDVIVFNETFTERGLFHGLVHAVQIQVLGLERYAELWVHGFLKTKTHYTVPLEVQAFSLASKFLRPAPERFSVEEEVRQWAAAGRY